VTFQRSGGFAFAATSRCPHRDYLFRVSADDDPRTTGRKHILATAEGAQPVDQVFFDPGCVQRIFRLIHQDRCGTVSQQRDQNGGAALTMGQLLDRGVAVFFGLPELDGENVGTIY
jgi:hypothetical protein